MHSESLVKRVKNKLIESFKNCFDGVSKPLTIVHISVVVLFALLFFSIPSVSFIKGLHYITWGLTILVLALMCFSFLIGNHLKIDVISCCFFAFIISALISCSFTKFISINITYFFLTIFLIVTYIYAKSNKNVCKLLILSIYAGSILFLSYYSVKYGKQMLSLGKIRLGSDFGDVNDIAIFNGIGLSIAIYYVFFSKKIIFKAMNGLLVVLFLLAILSSGSKIAYIFIPAVLIACIFFKIGKKKWWLSLIIVCSSIGIMVGLLQLPVLSTVRIKILSMINVFSKVESSEHLIKDYSTYNRFTMFKIGMEMFLRKPLFGYGVNGFQYFGGYSDGAGWSHNHISEMLSGTGIIGFALYNIPIFYSVYRAIKSGKFLPAVLMIFFIVTMLSIALPGEKLFAYSIGIILAAGYNPPDFIEFDFCNLFKNRQGIIVHD